MLEYDIIDINNNEDREEESYSQIDKIQKMLLRDKNLNKSVIKEDV